MEETPEAYGRIGSGTYIHTLYAVAYHDNDPNPYYARTGCREWAGKPRLTSDGPKCPRCFRK